jgi:alcohol dehydrogenase (cytochrome c)
MEVSGHEVVSRVETWSGRRGMVRVSLLIVVIATAALVVGCTPSPPPAPRPTTTEFPAAATPAGSWPYPNADLANTRVAPGSSISAANVAGLTEAWSFRLAGTAAVGIKGAGSLTAAPIVVGGVVYLQDEDADVYALSLATGRLKWERAFNIPESSGPGPDGLAVSGGAVYGDTATSVFSLNAKNGKTIWKDNHLLSATQGAFEIQPEVAGGRVFLASAYGSGAGGGPLFALSAATGKVVWKFNTVIGKAEGVKALGVGSGGAWETPLVGSDGSVTFGIGNPYQSLGSAISHPSRQLYTDSAVNLDAATGALRWYYQAVPNDFLDHDLQSSPVATTIAGAPAIIAGGKVGYVYALNGSSGALLWKTPVGVHDGNDADSLLALTHQFSPTLPLTVEPGPLGGILSNLAVADGDVYAATIDLGVKYTQLKAVLGNKAVGSPTGELESIDATTGKVVWDTKLSTMPLGAMTVSNDLVFTTLYSGELIALNRATGAIVFRLKLPNSTNAPITVFGNTVLVPAGGPTLSKKGGTSHPQLVAYTVP